MAKGPPGRPGPLAQGGTRGDDPGGCPRIIPRDPQDRPRLPPLVYRCLCLRTGAYAEATEPPKGPRVKTRTYVVGKGGVVNMDHPSLEDPQGRWVLTQCVIDGYDVTGAKLFDAMTVSRGEFILFKGDQDYHKGTIQLKGDKEPRALRWTFRIRDKVVESAGVIDVEVKRLTICCETGRKNPPTGSIGGRLGTRPFGVRAPELTGWSSGRTVPLDSPAYQRAVWCMTAFRQKWQGPRRRGTGCIRRGRSS